jgi:aspartate kinase
MSIVMKFGGTSVQNADAMKRVARIIAKRVDQRPLVVVSALAGVTQSLIDAASSACKSPAEFRKLLANLAARHLNVAEELIQASNRRKSAIHFLRRSFSEIRELMESVAVLQEVTPRTSDRISGYGELLSTFLLEAHLQECGIDAVWLDARKILITNNDFGKASPLTFFSLQRVREVITPLLERGTVPLIQGYIGGTLDSVPTTLGRGASDESATIFGNLLDADEIQIWTDVCGFLTADPKIDRNACTIPELTYALAAELSANGARVLHFNAIAWAQEKNIPIRILNSFQPGHPGTLIMEPALDVFALNHYNNFSTACE